MATLTWTIAAGSNPGEVLRRLGKQIENAASVVPDNVYSGASTVLTIDNAPSAGVASVQITAGPYQNAAKLYA
jgi:hypothetical protein